MFTGQLVTMREGEASNSFYSGYARGAQTVVLDIPSEAMTPTTFQNGTHSTNNNRSNSTVQKEQNAFQRFRSRNKKWSQDGLQKKHFDLTGRLVDILLVYTTTTMLYEGYTLLVPYFFDQFGEWNCYYAKVFITYVYIQAMANWLCVKCYTATYQKSKDRPDPNRKIWEDQQPPETTSQSVDRPTLMFNGAEVDEKWSEMLDRERTVLSWRWCKICEHHTPPRAHHCKICDACILKRDHHCYLTNTCIGFNNQRFFVVLCFYISLACVGSLAFGLKFLYNEYYATVPLWDYFLPVTIYRWYYGVYPIDAVFLICHLYLLPPVGFLCMGFLMFQVILIATGKTPFELLKNLHLKNSHSVSRNIESVFGRFWLMNFLLPFHLLYKQTDDPKNWPNLKIYYKGKLNGERITKNVTV